jgi:hypothetical protein
MLVTLRGAGDYIEKLPKKEHDRPERQTAIRDLMRAVADDKREPQDGPPCHRCSATTRYHTRISDPLTKQVVRPV